MKYFKKIDYLTFGIYIAAQIWSFNLDIIFRYMMFFCFIHLFPLMYLLRKHGYLSMKDELGMEATDKMDIMLQDLIIDPVNEFLANKPLITSLIRIVILSLVVFVLSYWLYPKILGFPSLDVIY